eukprot:COSAG01_NODE_904_length_12843_cov_83.351146_2_plen_2267_part_00
MGYGWLSVTASFLMSCWTQVDSAANVAGLAKVSTATAVDTAGTGADFTVAAATPFRQLQTAPSYACGACPLQLPFGTTCTKCPTNHQTNKCHPNKDGIKITLSNSAWVKHSHSRADKVAQAAKVFPKGSTNFRKVACEYECACLCKSTQGCISFDFRWTTKLCRMFKQTTLTRNVPCTNNWHRWTLVLPPPPPSPPPPPTPKCGSGLVWAKTKCIKPGCSFDTTTSSLCGWTTSNSDSLSGWTRGTTTPSVNTGAQRAQSGKYFVYLETSGGNKGDVSYLESPARLAAAKVRSMSFYYHMYGASMGSLSVEARVNGTWAATGWSLKGNQHTSDSAPWLAAAVNLPTGTNQVRFKGTDGTSWAGDMAIDSVQFSISPTKTCDASKAPVNGAVGDCTASMFPGLTCQPTCSAGYKISGPATCAGVGGVLKMPLCTKIPTCAPGYILNPGQTACFIQGDCGFDKTTSSLCGWTASGKKRWTRGTTTPSANTGAQRAQSGKYFVYLETSGGNKGDVSYLESPARLAAAKVRSMSFYYHMYGASMGSLSVEARVNGTWAATGWSLKGNQHTSDSAPWTQVAVNLPMGTNQVRFKGTDGTSWAGDMAVDSVQFSPLQSKACDASKAPVNGAVGDCTGSLSAMRSCQPTCNAGYAISGPSTCPIWGGVLTAATCTKLPMCLPGTIPAFVPNSAIIACVKPGCSFDTTTSSLCGWTASGKKRWTRGTTTPSANTGAQRAQSGKYFVYLETSGGNKGDVSYLESPARLAAAKVRSMSFYYHMYGASMGSLSVEARVNGTWAATGWSLKGNQHTSDSAPWTQVAVNLPMGTNQVRFKGTDGISWTGDMAIDSVQFSISSATACEFGSSACEYDWSTVIGSRVLDLTEHPQFPAEPNAVITISSGYFQTRSSGDDIGAMIEGFVRAPVTGNYTFITHSEDASEVWTASLPNTKSGIHKVAELDGCCRKVLGSKTVYWTANQTYYLLAILKAGRGDEYLKVGMKVGRAEYFPIPVSMFAPVNNVQPPVCSCKNGVALPFPMCTSSNAEACRSCNPGYAVALPPHRDCVRIPLCAGRFVLNPSKTACVRPGDCSFDAVTGGKTKMLCGWSTAGKLQWTQGAHTPSHHTGAQKAQSGKMFMFLETSLDAHLNKAYFTTKGSVHWNDHTATLRAGGGANANWIQSKKSYTRPLTVQATMRQVSGTPGCGVIAVFPTSAARHSGYNAGIGWWANSFGTGHGSKISKASTLKHGNSWHTVKIRITNTQVEFYLNGVLQRTLSDTQYKSGPIRLGNNCRNYEYKDVTVIEADHLQSASYLVSPTLSPQVRSVSFYYHMYGATMGTLAIEVLDLRRKWVPTKWSRTGKQHSSESDPWTLVRALPLPPGSTRMRYRGTRGTSSTGDMAIDSVSFELWPICTCQNGTQATQLACTKDQVEICVSCDEGFTLLNNTCIKPCKPGFHLPTANVPDVLPGSWSDSTSNIANACVKDPQCVCANGTMASFPSCSIDGASQCTSCDNGFWLSDALICRPSTLNCSFDIGSCGWTGTGETQWTRGTTSPYAESFKSAATQPQNGSHFMWLHHGGVPGSKHYLVSPIFAYSMNTRSMTFYYSIRTMAGADSGSLSVEAFVGNAWMTTGWTVEAHQQTSLDKPWNAASLKIPPTATQIRFVGIRGTCDSTYMAIDSLVFSSKAHATPVCTCGNGTAAKWPACQTDKAKVCASCSSGFHLKNGGCTPFSVCSCTNGNATEGSMCVHDGAPQCATCNVDFHIISSDMPTVAILAGSVHHKNYMGSYFLQPKCAAKAVYRSVNGHEISFNDGRWTVISSSSGNRSAILTSSAACSLSPVGCHSWREIDIVGQWKPSQAAFTAAYGNCSRDTATCSFDSGESICGWNVAGQRYWYRGQTAANRETGPYVAQSGTSFMALDSSLGQKGNTSYLISPPLPSDVERMAFYYHMYGSGVGKLAVEALVHGMWQPTGWALTGQQQAKQSDSWRKVELKLPIAATGVRFAATTGSNGTGDLAVDTLSFRSASTSCSFEKGACGWTMSGTAHWTRGTTTPSANTGATQAHDGLFFMFLETSTMSVGDISYLISPVISTSMRSMAFWYYMHGVTIGTLSVQALIGGHWVSTGWSITGQRHAHQNDLWSSAELELLAATQVRFTGTSAGHSFGDIAIDLVSFSRTLYIAPLYTCTCANGQAATGSSCTADKAKICASCDPGFTMDRSGIACVQSSATCSFDNPYDKLHTGHTMPWLICGWTESGISSDTTLSSWTRYVDRCTQTCLLN